jgi:hypothetical protein
LTLSRIFEVVLTAKEPDRFQSAEALDSINGRGNTNYGILRKPRHPVGLFSVRRDLSYHEDRKFKRGGVSVVVLAFDPRVLVA